MTYVSNTLQKHTIIGKALQLKIRKNSKDMNTAHFKEQLRKLQDKKFYGLTNNQVYSYIRIYHAIYMMITVNALDDEYGDRKIYQRKMKSLLNILLRRYNKETSVPVKMEQLYMIFFLYDNIINDYNKEEYLNCGADLIEGFLEENRDKMTDEEQYQLMRLIFVEWYGLIEDEDTDTPVTLTYAREQIKTWIDGLSPEGIWNDIDDSKALRRIILISFNSTIMLDDQYNDQLSRLYEHYCMQPLDAPQSITDIEKYIKIYYALQRAPIVLTINYTPQLTKLADVLSSQIPNLSKHRDYQTVCRYIEVDNKCQQISEEIQSQLLSEDW